MPISRRRLVVLLIVLVFGTTSLFAMAPGTGSRVALDALRLYRAHASPMMARLGIRCRFQPSCSRYAEGVIAKYGLAKGGLLTARRILRCTPLTPMGTVDLP